MRLKFINFLVFVENVPHIIFKWRNAFDPFFCNKINVGPLAALTIPYLTDVDRRAEELVIFLIRDKAHEIGESMR